MPASYDLKLYRGDTGRYAFVLYQDAAKTAPVDLTDATALAQIRDAPGGRNLADMDCTVTLPNRIDVVLPADQSATLPARGVWDLQVTMGGGDVTTVVAGKVYVGLDVTVP
jgi:hypothetical protein